MYALLLAAGHAETDPRASMIVGLICVGLALGAAAWIIQRVKR